MQKIKIKFISFNALATQLCLPKSYLRQLVHAKEIPFLDLGNGRKRFCIEDVQEALSKIASQSIEGRGDESS